MSESSTFNPYAAPPTLETGSIYEVQTGRLPLAARGDRFVGAFIDGIVVGIPTMALGIVMGIGLAMVFSPDSWAFQISTFVIGLPLGMGVFVAIQGHLLANYGQTVGKRVVKTQILDEQDRLVPFWPLMLKRYLPLWILGSLPYIGGLFGLGNALAIFRANRKCIHDEIAGTKVVKLG